MSCISRWTIEYLVHGMCVFGFPIHCFVNIYVSLVYTCRNLHFVQNKLNVITLLRHLNTSSLLCDCQLKWLPQWVAENNFQSFINASCAHPQLLKGRSIFAVSPDGFVCGEWNYGL